MNPKDLAKTRTQVHRPTRVHESGTRAPVICAACRGRGVTMVLASCVPDQTGDLPRQEMDCPRCGGTGYVEGE